MGCQADEIEKIDPAKQGEEVASYSLRAPLTGTVIAKDVVLKEQIRPDTQIMAIADLSTVWIEANIYEKDVPLLESIKDKSIKVRNAAWPNRQFEAKIFYTGEIMEEATRTIAMRAIAKNSDKLLKPGMFVDIQFQTAENDESVLQLPWMRCLNMKATRLSLCSVAMESLSVSTCRSAPRAIKQS